MPTFFDIWAIDSQSEHVFIKVDVEYFECQLLPSWQSWLSSMETKPTLFISMHSVQSQCSSQQYAAIARIARSYKYAQEGFLSPDKINIEGKKGEFVLSDKLPPPLLVKR